jgi:hypothetical protein
MGLDLPRQVIPEALHQEQAAALCQKDDGLAVAAVTWFDEFRRTKILWGHLEEVPALGQARPVLSEVATPGPARALVGKALASQKGRASVLGGSCRTALI